MTENDLKTRLRRAVSEFPVPTASVALLERIHTRIASGEPVLVQAASPRRMPSRVVLWWLLAAAVLGVVVALPSSKGPRPTPPLPVDAGWFVGPNPLAAQALPPGSPRIGILDGSKLPMGRWVYAVQPPGESVTPDYGYYDTATASRVTRNGRAAVLLTWVWGSRLKAGTKVDSGLVTGDSMFPIRWVSHLRSGSALTTVFQSDSVTRTWLRPDGSVEVIRVPIEQPPEWANGMTLVGWEEWTMFPLLPLHREWRGHVAVIGVANTGEFVTRFWAYRVTGEDRVTVPAGTFECWTVQYEPAVGEESGDYTFWVDKRTGWVVKAGSPSNRWGREQVLVSFEPW